ncbi:MAG: hypothetical protein ACE5DI_01145 [Candidatus Micrarchaeia archaeon]
MNFFKAVADGFKIALTTRLSLVALSFFLWASVLALAPIAISAPIILMKIMNVSGIEEFLQGAVFAAGTFIQYYLALAIVFVTASAWLDGTLAAGSAEFLKTRKANNEKASKKALSKIADLLLATLAIIVIAITASVALSLGTTITLLKPVFALLRSLAGILVGLLFFFTAYSIMIGNKKAFEALEESMQLFQKNALQVLLLLLATSILGTIIIILFALPLVFAFALSIVSTALSGGTTAFLSLFLVSLATLILLTGLSLSQTLTAGITTSAYMQLKNTSRKRPSKKG